LIETSISREIEQLLYNEARLLDERKYKEWLELFTDDLHYWAPVLFNKERGGKEISNEKEQAYFDDDRASLSLRVRRLYTEFVVAEDPPSRTCRIISNLQIENGEHEDEFNVRSNFLIYKNRLENEVNLFAGHREDVMRKVGMEWKIARRKIVLSQNVLADRHITLFF
jgi:3-phenylpropionate/cinnamic acid dioxygenase small subunit